jgi:uncharacterized membrane protein YccC
MIAIFVAIAVPFAFLVVNPGQARTGPPLQYSTILSIFGENKYMSFYGK